MSRIGRTPIEIPKGVRVEVKDGSFTAEGPKGRVNQKLIPGYDVRMEEGIVHVVRPGETAPEKAKHGLLRSLLANAVTGVSTGFSRVLEINGVGYKAELRGQEIHLALGYSHPVIYKLPSEVQVEIDPKANRLTFTSPDRQKLGQVCAEVRNLRRPDPYKAKGIKYADEVLRRKVGKAGAK